MIDDLKRYYERLPINDVRKALRDSKTCLQCLKILVDFGFFEEAHFTALRTLVEHQIAILEEIVRVSEETIKSLKENG